METERTEGPAPVATTARLVMLLLAAAAIIGGSFLTWLSFGDIGEALGDQVPKTAGVNLELDIYYTPLEEDPTGASFISSAGLVTIGAGILVLLGLLIAWLARLGGAVALIAYVAFVVTLYRTPANGPFDFGFGNVGLGMWLVLVGGLLALIGGFLTGRRTVVTTTSAPPPPAEP